MFWSHTQIGLKGFNSVVPSHIPCIDGFHCDVIKL